MNILLKGHCTNGKKGRGKRKPKRPSDWNWGEPQQKAFSTLIEKLTTAPILAFADYSLPFTLHTDASGSGLGAVLYQKQVGVDRVIAYVSRGLKPSEKRYPAHKLEFLALKWAVTDKFHDYLIGTSFSVITDNNPLTYVLTTAKLDATMHRWVAALANFNFSISYRAGRLNGDADALSRMPEVFPDVIKAVCTAVTADIPLVESVSTGIMPPSAEGVMYQETGFDTVDWKEQHQSDEVLSRVIYLLRSGFRPREEGLHQEAIPVQKFLRAWNRLTVEKGILYRTTAQDGEPVRHLVIPQAFRQIALKGVHDDVGHPGKDKTLWLARQRFYWPGLESDVNSRTEQCGRCIRRKAPQQFSGIIPIKTYRPMELVCTDFLSLEMSKGGYEHILVVTDHFTRFAQAIPCRNQTAQTTANHC